MLISRRDDRLCFVTQPDHAGLAGELAQRWGNARFVSGARHPSLVTAAARHDDGWAAIDDGPAVSESDGRPAHFLEVDLPDTIAPYGFGVDRLYADDVYAGVLTSRHWAGLYSSRWGVQDSPPVGHPAALAVVEEQDARAARESRTLWGGEGLRSAFEADLWRDYEVLQALDFLSLALCLLDVEVPTSSDVPPLQVPATLRSIEQPPGGRLIPNVPTDEDEHVTVELAVLRPGVVVLDPYPFDVPAVDAGVRARLIDDVRHVDAESAARAYHDAEPLTIAFTIVPRHR